MHCMHVEKRAVRHCHIVLSFFACRWTRRHLCLTFNLLWRPFVFSSCEGGSLFSWCGASKRRERERDAMVVQIFALFREMLLPMSLSTRGEHTRMSSAESAISSIRGRDLLWKLPPRITRKCEVDDFLHSCPSLSLYPSDSPIDCKHPECSDRSFFSFMQMDI